MSTVSPTPDSQIFDVFVIGGGVNGCGIARDAAGRGYSVFLAEMNDLASGTSSASTKLIHGGLRYLEHYEFRLVREALIEREILWSMAPHIIWPLRFVLPHHKGLRPKWLLRLGLFLFTLHIAAVDPVLPPDSIAIMVFLGVARCDDERNLRVLYMTFPQIAFLPAGIFPCVVAVVIGCPAVLEIVLVVGR